MTKSRLRWLLVAACCVLYAISIPWYRPNDEEVRIVLGLPHWVTVAIGCYVGVAVLNCIAWMLTPVPDALDDTGAGTQEGAEQ